MSQEFSTKIQCANEDRKERKKKIAIQKKKKDKAKHIHRKRRGRFAVLDIGREKIFLFFLFKRPLVLWCNPNIIFVSSEFSL